MTSEINNQTISDDISTIMEKTTNNTETVEMPDEFLHSGYVAVATVVSFLVLVGVIVGIYHVQANCSKWKKKEKKNQSESQSPEKLREDSVVIHDVEFPNDVIYGVGSELEKDSDNGKKPEPSPSVFHDSVFFDDVMTSVAALTPRPPEGKVDLPHAPPTNVSCVNQILTDVLSKLPAKKSLSNESSSSSSSNQDETTNRLRRNRSYENAIREGRLTSSSSIGTNFLPNNKSVPESNVDDSNDVYDNTNELLDICMDVEIDESLLDVPKKNKLFPSTGKWQSTPILDYEDKEKMKENNDQEVESLKEVDISDPGSILKVSRSYSPVYKMHNSSFSRSSYLSSMISGDESRNNNN